MRSARYLLIASSVALLESVFSAPQPQPAQHVFPLCPDPDRTVTFYESHTESHILSILSQYEDPVEAMLSLHPSLEAELAEPRLLQIMDKEGETRWMTEGDKMRLRRAGVDFIDLTGRSGFVYVDAEPSEPLLSLSPRIHVLGLMSPSPPGRMVRGPPRITCSLLAYSR